MNTAVTAFLGGAVTGAVAYPVAANTWRYWRNPPVNSWAAWTLPPACWPPITPPDPTEEEHR